MSLLPHIADQIAARSGLATYEMRGWMEDIDSGVAGLLDAATTLSIVNTTTTPVEGAGGLDTFNGVFEKNNARDVMVSCKTDQPGTLYFIFSNDQANEDTFPVQGFSVAAGIHEFHVALKGPRWFRVKFVNGSSTDQTYLRIYTYFGTFRQGNSPLNQSQGLDADAILSRPTSFQDEVTRGLRGGVEQWNKFGYRDNLTAAGGEQTLWASSGSDLVIMTAAETFDITYNNATDGDGTTGALQLTFYYLDANENLAIAQHTLGSTGSDTTSFTGLGINRCVVTSSGSNNTNANAITISNTTSGNEQAQIPAGGGVTQQAFFFMPDEAVGATKWLFFNANKLSGSNPKVLFKGYVYNRTVDCAFEVFRHTMDTQSENSIIIEDPCNFRLSNRDVLYFVADTDQNNTVVSCRFSLNVYDAV